jgi:predicted nucleic acid-binding protein
VIHVADAHTGLYCGKIIGEYLEKLIDLRHPPERAMRFITYLIGAFSRITIVTENAPTRPADLDDEIFLLCAIDGEAHYLVSDDRGLLALSVHYDPLVICNGSDAVALLGA